MPHLPSRPCPGDPRCPNKAGACDVHRRRPSSLGWNEDTQRLRGRALQKARASLFARQPLCCICEHAGRLTVATIRDHITPLSEGGLEREDNVQGLCAQCSLTKSQAEAQRGRRLIATTPNASGRSIIRTKARKPAWDAVYRSCKTRAPRG